MTGILKVWRKTSSKCMGNKSVFTEIKKSDFVAFDDQGHSVRAITET